MGYLNDPKAEEFTTGILITGRDFELDGHEFDKMLDAKLSLVRAELKQRAQLEYWDRQTKWRQLKDWWNNLAWNSGQW